MCRPPNDALMILLWLAVDVPRSGEQWQSRPLTALTAQINQKMHLQFI